MLLKKWMSAFVCSEVRYRIEYLTHLLPLLVGPALVLTGLPQGPRDKLGLVLPNASL